MDNESLHYFYFQNELTELNKIHTPTGFLPQTFVKILRSFEFYAGLVLLPPLIMMRRIFLDRRIRFLILFVLVLAAGMLIEIFLIPHYLAPFTAAFYAIGLLAMRHLHVWSPGGKRGGATIIRLEVAACLILASLRLFPGPLLLTRPEWPASAWSDRWFGRDHCGTERARVESGMEQLPGQQLVIVRYSARHNPLDEWVYNAPDIDDSKFVWAREMDSAHNLELLHYYMNRKVWLVEPDSLPATVLPYLETQKFAADSR